MFQSKHQTCPVIRQLSDAKDLKYMFFPYLGDCYVKIWHTFVGHTANGSQCQQPTGHFQLCYQLH